MTNYINTKMKLMIQIITVIQKGNWVFFMWLYVCDRFSSNGRNNVIWRKLKNHVYVWAFFQMYFSKLNPELNQLNSVFYTHVVHPRMQDNSRRITICVTHHNNREK